MDYVMVKWKTRVAAATLEIVILFVVLRLFG